MEKKNNKKNAKEKIIRNEDIAGKKFEDLDADEMAKVQGSGDDVKPEDLKTIFGLIKSKNTYNCK